MFNPQVEDGYVKVANELMEAIYRFPFCGEELRVLLFAIRFTYGFNRKKAGLSLSFIAKGTGLHRRNVARTVKRLVSRLTLVRQGSDVNINKNYNQWVVSRLTPSVKSAPKVVSTLTPKKGQLRKTTISAVDKPPRTKKIKKDPDEPQTLNQFAASCESSSQEHIKIIGRWAQITEPDCRTREQWGVFLRKHLKTAIELAKFLPEQRAIACERVIDYAKAKGFTPALQTVLKFIV